MGQFIWPCNGRFTSGFGHRKLNYQKASENHKGIDIAASAGTSIVAARSGTVTKVSFSSVRGNYLIINHGSGFATLYQHCSKILAKTGNAVNAGVRIALVGSTGNSTGPHLHFEIHKNGTPVDPMSYVKQSDTLSNYTGGPIANTGANGIAQTTDASDSAAAVVHIPQTEKVYTIYESDSPQKRPDAYAVTWQASSGRVRDITSRVGGLTLKDDTDSLCVELSFNLMEATDEKFLTPLKVECGDMVAVLNTGSSECIFLGQVESVSGSYRDAMAVTCLDAGRLLTTNDVILQFNNVAAKTALSQLANKVGITAISCPNLISSVYGIEKDNAATIAQNILETVTAENGVNYFLRMMGKTLVIRSFGRTCIKGYFRQASNLPAFDIMGETSNPQVSWSISDLRNHVTVYSEADSSVSVQATASDAASVKRYGQRGALETFSDQDTVTAAAKARSVLAQKNKVTEEFSITTYGSDRIVAGARLAISLAEISGEFWVVGVTHNLGALHTMALTLRRAD